MSSLRTNQESDLIKQEVRRQVKNCPTVGIRKGITSPKAKVALAHFLQLRSAFTIQNGRQKAPLNPNNDHYDIASIQPPERQPLERRTLVPKYASDPEILIDLVLT